MSPKKIILNGITNENPTFRLVLGTCPTIAVTTSLTNALGMGGMATLVLICSNVLIALLKDFIPSKVRIPAYIVIIAMFVTIVQLFLKAFLPELNESLGIFIPLIVVNCIILGRAESFASKNPVGASALDGLGIGIGFTLSLSLIAIVRELLGSGTIMGASVFGDGYQPVLLFVLAPGGFLVYGLLMALLNKTLLSKKYGGSDEEEEELIEAAQEGDDK